MEHITFTFFWNDGTVSMGVGPSAQSALACLPVRRSKFDLSFWEEGDTRNKYKFVNDKWESL